MAFETHITAGSNAAPAGAPFPAGAANNGLSVSASDGRIVLGNDAGDISEPARLLSNREINTNNFQITFKDSVGGAAAVLLNLINGRLEYSQVGAFNLGVLIATFLQGYIKNTGTGSQVYIDERMGNEAGNELVTAFSSATSSQVNGCPRGSTISARGADGGVMYVHSEADMHLRAGGALPTAASDNILLTSSFTTFLKEVRFSGTAARTSSSSVLVRQGMPGALRYIQGVTGSFTTVDGKTVTVTDGVITNIV